MLCDAATTEPRLVIELDDTSHNRSDRKARDAFVDAVLAQVGLPIMHVPWQRRYDSQRLAEGIYEKLQLPQAQVATSPIGESPAGPPTVQSTCGQCQHELRPEARFCHRCGAVLVLP